MVIAGVLFMFGGSVIVEQGRTKPQPLNIVRGYSCLKTNKQTKRLLFNKGPVGVSCLPKFQRQLPVRLSLGWGKELPDVPPAGITSKSRRWMGDTVGMSAFCEDCKS